MCKTITCTLVIPICPRSASCSPINITPYRAAHSRNPLERPKFFVTPPEGSARRRTVHGAAVSSLGKQAWWARAVLGQSGHRPEGQRGMSEPAMPTPSSRLPRQSCVCLAEWSCPYTSFPLGDSTPTENLNLKMKTALCSSMSEWLDCIWVLPNKSVQYQHTLCVRVRKALKEKWVWTAAFAFYSNHIQKLAAV